MAAASWFHRVRTPHAVAVMLLTIVAACRDAGVVSNSYATVAEARQSGAIEQGWMPASLPAGSHEMREAHDPATRRRWGLFSFSPDDAAALREWLGPEVPVMGRKCEPPRRIEWWPLLLRGPLDSEQITATGLQTYQLQQERLIFAVNWRQRRAYYCTYNP